MKNNKICVLFDMDGVMIDTEPQYDKFWQQASAKYSIGIPNFEKIIKGTTLPNILKKYFSEFTKEEIDSLVKSIDKLEAEMDFPEIPGSVDFVKKLKAKGIKVGLVTSSTDTKMVGVNKEKHFDTLFDTVVTGSRVEHGKPNPDCFLLAAKDLGVDPKDCIVFEDSFAGIEAGKAAGMKVVGLATTHPENMLIDKCAKVILNFVSLDVSFLNEI